MTDNSTNNANLINNSKDLRKETLIVKAIDKPDEFNKMRNELNYDDTRSLMKDDNQGKDKKDYSMIKENFDSHQGLNANECKNILMETSDVF